MEKMEKMRESDKCDNEDKNGQILRWKRGTTKGKKRV